MRQDHILLGLIGAPQSMFAIAPPNFAACDLPTGNIAGLS
jgi:hypothetical protein